MLGKGKDMKLFENSLSLALVVVAQALAVGIVLTA